MIQRHQSLSQRIARMALMVAEGELGSGAPLQVPPPLLLFTDASWAGWRAHLQFLTAVGIWSSVEKDLHINIL